MMNYVEIALQAIVKSTESEESEVSEERSKGDGLNSYSGDPALDQNDLATKEWELVSIGPWHPTTPEEEAEEQHRVIEEDPPRWWWKPRYRLIELESGGMDHAAAVAQVRAEYGGDHEP